MEKELIEVKSEGEILFTYELERPESLTEAVSMFGEEKALEYLRGGHKTSVNAKKWAEHKGRSTEVMDIGGKQFKVNKQLAEAIRQAQAAQATAA
jgi:hypothetical protein